jgi:hypothetical protein
MKTECTGSRLWFQALGRRDVVADFDGGTITTDGGALLLREVEARTGILRQFAACFTDYRNPELIEHTVPELIAQRVLGLALGYEDLNDHDELRLDPLLAVLVDKQDPTGQDRLRQRDKGKALAGKSTLNRLELTPVGADAESRYKKIVANLKGVERLFVEFFLQAHPQPPERIVLDLDATDDPVHGDQLGRFFHGYYGEYCFLPLYVFCGKHLLGSWLRPANIDASAGALEKVARIVARLREKWPGVKIVLRGDVAFGRRVRRPHALREGVLRPRRDGEPHQGAAALSVCRSDQRGVDAGEPTAAVLLVGGVHAPGGPPAAKLGKHASGPGPVRHDPPEAVEGRGADPGDRAEGLDFAGGGLPL